jgi:outer membrane protein TolC
VDNVFGRNNLPLAGLDPDDPTRTRVLLGAERSHDYLMSMDLAKRTTTGATARFRVNTNPTTFDLDDLALNPQSRSSLEWSYLQPLLQGGGYPANVAPIVIARIDTERSFFRMKDSMQRMVLGVIEAYWGLVFARTDLWVRKKQVEQGEFGFKRADAQFRVGRETAGNVAQARSALQNFIAAEITARGNVLQREDALRNILGLPPANGAVLVPCSPPLTQWMETDWHQLVDLAEAYRPEIVELKLIIEADQQQLLLARNQALPRVDAFALYRWNGLAGRTPDRRILFAGPGEFPEWEYGVNFSVPLGLRQERAAMRRQELVILRDRANLDQGLHRAVHELAIAYRNLAQFYQEYQSLQKAREAARVNLEAQYADFISGSTLARQTIYLNVLQAITNWGNAVSAEAQALSEYNIELANLELQTGTILEAHGIRFVEERYGSIGPLGRLAAPRCYPRDVRPCPNADRYEKTSQPAENAFNLQDPVTRRRRRTAPYPGTSPRNGKTPPLGERSSGSVEGEVRIPERILTPRPERPGY